MRTLARNSFFSLCISIAFCLMGSAHAGNVAPSYDSEFNASRPAGTSFVTPEDNARPGEFYFYKAAEAISRKQYTFATQMFTVAASWAYKPAEYNLGVMYFSGDGVPVDRPRGMAWMSLAAERNDSDYVDARELYYAQLSPEEFAKANEIWRELKKTYGDDVALKRAKARWREVRNGATGSRLGFVGSLVVGSPNGPKGGTPVGKPRGSQAGNMGDTMGASPFGLTGGNQVDGSEAYRQLRESDNPYDPKFRTDVGTVAVGALIPGDKKSEVKPEKPAGESEHR